MSPIVAGFLLALPISIIIIVIVIWLINRYEKKLDTIILDQDIKDKILTDEIERKKFNDEIYQILKTHRKYTIIVGPIIFIGAALTIIILYVSDMGYIITLVGELYAVILIINLILLFKWGWPNMKYVLEVVKLEEETQRRILNEENHRLLFFEAKRKRKKIQFMDEKAQFVSGKPT